jgi:L-Ala-D/L-Glu epimerase
LYFSNSFFISILKIKHYLFHLPFRHAFTISKGTKTQQGTFIVCLEVNGVKGFGEAPEIAYYNIPLQKMESDLLQVKEKFEAYHFEHPKLFSEFLFHLFPQNSFLICALDIAAWDLYAKLQNKSVSQCLELDLSKAPISDYTIGIDSIENMKAKIKAKPWPIYKIKLGTAHDLEIIKALRTTTDAPFRIDANAAWSLDEAIQKIEKLEQYNVEWIEQPLAKDQWDEMKILYKASPLPLIADEACVHENDVKKCSHHFHGINIKLTKCGGITPALRMIEEARALGLKILLGCMNESSIGSAAIAHLSPLADYLDMDGPLLLKKDLASGLGIDNGKFSLDKKSGLSVEVSFNEH